MTPPESVAMLFVKALLMIIKCDPQVCKTPPFLLTLLLVKILFVITDIVFNPVDSTPPSLARLAIKVY